MGKNLPQQGVAPGARVIDPGIAEAKAKAEAFRAYWTKEGDKEIERIRAEQRKEYSRVVDLVQRADGLLRRPIRLEHERLLWFLLRCGPPQTWLPPADWGRNAYRGPGGAAGVAATRALIMVNKVQGFVPDISSNQLHAEVMASEPWKHRAGKHRADTLAPAAWVFALLLEAAGAAWDAETLGLVFDLASYAKGRDAPAKRHGGQKAQAVRQALKGRDRKVGQERLAFARRMARLWYVRDVWGLEARIRERRGNPREIAPTIPAWTRVSPSQGVKT